MIVLGVDTEGASPDSEPSEPNTRPGGNSAGLPLGSSSRKDKDPVPPDVRTFTSWEFSAAPEVMDKPRSAG
ncbi:hypothetical protein D3C72_2287590 [compost metagenome]